MGCNNSCNTGSICGTPTALYNMDINVNRCCCSYDSLFLKEVILAHCKTDTDDCEEATGDGPEDTLPPDNEQGDSGDSGNSGGPDI